MADTIEYEEGYDFGGNTSDDANPIVPFRQDSLNLVDIVEEQGTTYQHTITDIKELDLSYCPKYAYCRANDKLYEYDATSTAADDDVDVLLPSSLVGRWLTAKDYSTSVTVSKTYVDEQDAAVLEAAEDYADARCEDGAEVNIIESISVNSVAVAPDGSRNVDIAVPENTSELSNDSNFIADATYVHTDNNYTNAEKSKLSGIATGAQVNVIETVKVNGDSLSIVNKAVDITTTKGDDGDSAYEVAVAEGYSGSQAEWLASLVGTSGTKWHTTAESLVVGSDVIITDITEAKVGDYVFSTKNTVWGKIKGIVGSDYIITGVMNILEPVQVTYEELYALKESNNLTPGQVYEITDYSTTYKIEDDILTGSVEPLLVTAKSVNELHPEAKSKTYPQDTVFYNIENSLNSLKGRIYRRIDNEKNNDVDIDFRTVKVRRRQTTANAWSSEINYGYVDIVLYNGSFYLSLKDNNLDNITSKYWAKLNLPNLSYASFNSDGSVLYAVAGITPRYGFISTGLEEDLQIFGDYENSYNIKITGFNNIRFHSSVRNFECNDLGNSYFYGSIDGFKMINDYYYSQFVFFGNHIKNSVSLNSYLNLHNGDIINSTINNKLGVFTSDLVDATFIADSESYNLFTGLVKNATFKETISFYSNFIYGKFTNVYAEAARVFNENVFHYDVDNVIFKGTFYSNTINAKLSNITFDGNIQYLIFPDGEINGGTIKGTIMGDYFSPVDLSSLVLPNVPCRMDTIDSTPLMFKFTYLNDVGRTAYMIVGLDASVIETGVYETETNKEADIETYKESTTKYPTLKGLYDWAVAKFLLATKLVTSWSGTPSHENIPSEKLVYDDLAELDTNKIEYNTVINSLDTEDKTLNGAINEINAIAKGAANGETFATISALVTDLNIALNYPYGRNLYVVDIEVPDFWISAIAETSVPYTYSDDATFLSDMAITGSLQVGLFIISELETQKVDLTDYYTKSETDGQIASATKQIHTGVAVTGTGTGISATVLGSKEGDYYKNTTTSFWYIATAPNTWDYKGSDKGIQGIQGEKGDPLEFSDYQQEPATNSSEYLVFFKDVGGTPTPRIMTFQDLKDLLAAI